MNTIAQANSGYDGLFSGTMNCTYLQLWKYSNILKTKIGTTNLLEDFKNSEEIKNYIKEQKKYPGVSRQKAWNKIANNPIMAVFNDNSEAIDTFKTQGIIQNRSCVFSITQKLVSDINEQAGENVPIFYVSGEQTYSHNKRIEITLNKSFIYSAIRLDDRGHRQANSFLKSILYNGVYKTNWYITYNNSVSLIPILEENAEDNLDDNLDDNTKTKPAPNTKNKKSWLVGLLGLLGMLITNN